MNEQRTNKGKIQKTKKMLRGNGSQAKLKLAESEQRENRMNSKKIIKSGKEAAENTKKTDIELVKVVKKQKVNKKTGQVKNIYYQENEKEFKQKVGSKKIFIDKNGRELEGILQKDGLYHFSNPKKIVILYKDRLDIINTENGERETKTTETTPFSHIIEIFNELKNDFDIFCIDIRQKQDKTQDDLRNLEKFSLFNNTEILNTTFKANEKYTFYPQKKNDFEFVDILFTNEINGSVDLDYIHMFFTLVKQALAEQVKNKENIAFSLNKYIRAVTAREKNEDIRKMDKDFFLNKLLYFAHTFCDISATKGLTKKWTERKRDPISEEMANSLESAGVDIEEIKKATTREIHKLDPILSFSYEVFKDKNNKTLDAIFYIKPELFTSVFYSFDKGFNEFVTLEEKFRRLPTGVHWTPEIQALQLNIARDIQNYTTQGKIVFKQDFLKDKEFTTRKAKSDYIKMLKRTLKHLQEQKLKNADNFYFDGGILKLCEHATKEKQQIKTIEHKK